MTDPHEPARTDERPHRPRRRTVRPPSPVVAIASAIAVALATLLSPATGRAGAEVDRYLGVSALAGDAGVRAASTIVARLDVRPVGPNDRLLDISETRAGATLRSYASEMTKPMHLIAISDDFSTFEHLHPTLEGNGHFTVVFHAPKAGGYHLYADAVPTSLGKTVFRFDVPVVAGGFDARTRVARATTTGTHVSPTAKVVRVGPYAVALGTLDLHAARPTMLDVSILKNGRLANDLRPYLGGAAHAVFIDTATLAYVHVHPTTSQHGGAGMAHMDGMADMPAMSRADTMPRADAMPMGDDAPLPDGAHVDAAMSLHVGALAAGTYKLWLQFRGADGLHVAPFVLDAR